MTYLAPAGLADSIRSVGVVGAGQMGSGIAQVFALAGFTVNLLDLAKDRLAAGLGTITNGLDRLVAKGRIDAATKAQALARIAAGVEYALLSGCDLVIEATAEKETIKRAVIEQLCTVLGPDAIIASNTSSISITRLAAATDRPGKFMGVHFMNPVPAMEPVQLIRGVATHEHTCTVMRHVVSRIGKSPVMTDDFPSFAIRGILQPMINDAVYALYERVGSEGLDAVVTRTGQAMGPLELADLVGLDTCLAMLQVLEAGLADTKQLLSNYVEAGWLGRKTGRGFHDYRQAHTVGAR